MPVTWVYMHNLATTNTWTGWPYTLRGKPEKRADYFFWRQARQLSGYCNVQFCHPVDFFVSSQNLVLLSRTYFFPRLLQSTRDRSNCYWMNDVLLCFFSFCVHMCSWEHKLTLRQCAPTCRQESSVMQSPFQISVVHSFSFPYSLEFKPSRRSNPREVRRTCVGVLWLHDPNYFGRGSIFGRQQHSKHFLRSKMSPKIATIRYEVFLERLF